MKKVAIIFSILAVLAILIFIALGNQRILAAFQNRQPDSANEVLELNSTAEATKAIQESVRTGDTVVSACKLVPLRYVNIGFNTSGQVAEVFVSAGDEVTEGQLLARLGNRAQLEASVANAELELSVAQQTMKDLYDNAPLAAAEAYQALILAPEDVQEIERQLAIAEGVYVNETDLEIARANLALAEKRLSTAEQEYQPYANKPKDDLTRARLLNKLSEAQDGYNSALRNLNALEGGASEKEIAQLEADLALAKVKQAEAERKYEVLKNGPDPDEVALSEARVKNAEAQLKAAREALDGQALLSPFSGTIVNLDIKVGEYVSPGVPLVLLVDFNDWRVETTDLTELNIVRISTGNSVRIIFDALPDQKFQGIVQRIVPQGENQQGDIIYQVIVDPDLDDDRLLWNMSCSAEIEVNK